MFEGSTVALVTPFQNGALDEAAFRKLIRFHIENGTDGILVAGCTGEAANLSIGEVQSLVRWAREELDAASRHVFLLAGTGSNSTALTIERTLAVEDSGVDGVLLITPYYNKPTPAGQISHYSLVASSTKLPVVLYNVPGRTGVDMQAETVAELAKIDNIVAIKEAGGNVDKVSEIALLSDITILSGDDTLTLPMMAVGAAGVVSVTANIAPDKVAGMCRAWRNGDIAVAKAFHRYLFDLSRTMFVETNPLPVKAALAMMGFIREEFRLPLVPAQDASREFIREMLVKKGIQVVS